MSDLRETEIRSAVLDIFIGRVIQIEGVQFARVELHGLNSKLEGGHGWINITYTANMRVVLVQDESGWEAHRLNNEGGIISTENLSGSEELLFTSVARAIKTPPQAIAFNFGMGSTC